MERDALEEQLLLQSESFERERETWEQKVSKMENEYLALRQDLADFVTLWFSFHLVLVCESVRVCGGASLSEGRTGFLQLPIKSSGQGHSVAQQTCVFCYPQETFHSVRRNLSVS